MKFSISILGLALLPITAGYAENTFITIKGLNVGMTVEEAKAELKKRNFKCRKYEKDILDLPEITECVQKGESYKDENEFGEESDAKRRTIYINALKIGWNFITHKDGTRTAEIILTPQKDLEIEAQHMKYTNNIESIEIGCSLTKSCEEASQDLVMKTIVKRHALELPRYNDKSRKARKANEELTQKIMQKFGRHPYDEDGRQNSKVWNYDLYSYEFYNDQLDEDLFTIKNMKFTTPQYEEGGLFNWKGLGEAMWVGQDSLELSRNYYKPSIIDETQRTIDAEAASYKLPDIDID